MRRLAPALAVVAALISTSGWATSDYGLVPVRVAEDTYVFLGRTEHFSFENGGNIVNTGFIVTDDGVVVIDTGPSRRYGEQMRAAIATITTRPIERVYLTHHHPDHFLGNQAFSDVPLLALPGTRQAMQSHADAFTENLYRLVGDWMRGTEPVMPTDSVEPGRVEVGGHRLQLMASGGHTEADLMILDETTGVLFAGDLVFHQRAPTTPHADPDAWVEALSAFEGLRFSVLVPGHGPVQGGARGVGQTRDYLDWLRATLRGAAAGGLNMMEAMELTIPERFNGLAVLPQEYHRSVSHLFPAYERAALPRVADAP